MDDASSKFRYIDLVKFKEFITSLRLDYEEQYWPILNKLVRSLSRFLDELEAR